MGANLRLGAYSNKYGNFHLLSLARFHHLPGPVFDKKEETKAPFVVQVLLIAILINIPG